MSPPVVQPLHDLSFPYGPSVQSAAFSPDGKTVYANVPARTFDFGAVLDQGFVAGAAVGCALLLLLVVVLSVRVLRRPRRVGVLYCRRCNYCLEGLAASQANCPECGVELATKKPVVGRSLVRRNWAAWVLAAVTLALAAGAVTHRRNMWSFQERGWASVGLSLRLWNSGLNSCVPNWCWGRGEVIVAVDARTGKWREVTRRASVTYFAMCVTPDGEGLYVQPATARGIDVISLKDGDTLARWRRDEFVMLGIGGAAVIGHTDGGSVSWLSLGTGQPSAGLGSMKAEAVRWNRRTGEWSTAASLDAYEGNWAQQFLLVPGTNPPELLAYPDFMESYDTKTFVVRWFSADGTNLSEADLGTAIATHRNPVVFTPDGGLLLAGGTYSDAQLFGFDAPALRRGRVELIGNVAVPGEDRGGLDQLAFAGDMPNRLILSEGDRAFVRDINAKQWIAKLVMTADLYAAAPVISDDGKWAAAVAQGGGMSGAGTWFHRLVIWRLPEVVEESGSKGGHK